MLQIGDGGVLKSCPGVKRIRMIRQARSNATEPRTFLCLVPPFLPTMAAVSAIPRAAPAWLNSRGQGRSDVMARMAEAIAATTCGSPLNKMSMRCSSPRVPTADPLLDLSTCHDGQERALWTSANICSRVRVIRAPSAPTSIYWQVCRGQRRGRTQQPCETTGNHDSEKGSSRYTL